MPLLLLEKSHHSLTIFLLVALFFALVLLVLLVIIRTPVLVRRRLPDFRGGQLQEALRTRNITALDRLFDAVEALGPQAAGLAAHLRELSQQYDLSSIAHVLDENGPG